MLELHPLRKNKINLADYNSQQDIEIHLLMSDFSPFDLQVLEEILFSPLKISFKKLMRSLQTAEPALLSTLDKLKKGNLLVIQEDLITVDKEVRKNFEFQIQRFCPEFKPDMEFLQGLLKKVPIHLLPIWYAIPRSSDNIFASIVEKYLLTPQIFQRYISELHFNEAHTPEVCLAARGIMNDLLMSHDFTLASSDIIAKYNLPRALFEEAMLLLEFHFIATVHFVKAEDHWDEIITPFSEWHEYLRFQQRTKSAFLDPSKISNRQQMGFSQSQDQSPKEVRNALQRALHGQWILFDDFLKGAMIPLNIDSIATLTKIGKQWKYTSPLYSEGDKETFQKAIFHELFSKGFVAIGTYEGGACFSVTPQGRMMLEG